MSGHDSSFEECHSLEVVTTIDVNSHMSTTSQIKPDNQTKQHSSENIEEMDNNHFSNDTIQNSNEYSKSTISTDNKKDLNITGELYNNVKDYHAKCVTYLKHLKNCSAAPELKSQKIDILQDLIKILEQDEPPIDKINTFTRKLMDKENVLSQHRSHSMLSWITKIIASIFSKKTAGERFASSILKDEINKIKQSKIDTKTDRISKNP